MKIKFATDNHPAEKVLQKIEQLLMENNAALRVSHHGLVFEMDANSYAIQDIDKTYFNNQVSYLPRQSESEKIIVENSETGD